VAALFRRRRLDRELDEEVAFHVSMLEQECIAAGMSPVEARRAARREFGGVAQTKEAYRDVRSVLWVEDTVRDLRHALRRLKSKPGFTSAAVLSLALGIGSATAVFSLFQPLMMRKLPVPKPHELAVFEVTGGVSALAQMRFYSVPYPFYREVAARGDLFSGVAATTGGGRMLADPETYGELVSGNYFSVLGVAPALGRLFSEADNREGNKVAVISYDLWQRRFGGAPGALGRRIDGYEIIGVAREGFNGVDADRRSEMWLPAAKYGQLDEPAASWIRMIGRCAPGVSDEQRQAALDVLAARYFDRVSTPFDAVSRRITMERRLKLRDGSLGFSAVRDQFGSPLLLLMGAVSVLLLAACVNVAGLIFARALAERRERALRIALGAGRARIVRQSLIESAVLGLSGGFVGLLFAAAGRRFVLHFLPASVGKPFDSSYVAAFLFSLGLLVASTVAFGLIPAFRASTLDPAAGRLQARGPESRARGSLRKWLMIAQVAFSAVLVGLAALFGASLAELRSSGSRFPNRDVLALSARFGAGPSGRADFIARIEALLRRASQVLPSAGRQFGNVQVDFKGTQVMRDGEPVSLSAKEFQLLRYLMEHPGETLSRDRLLSDVWGYEGSVSTRTVDVHVAWLRQKLEPDPKQPRHILTVHGLGYQFAE
jgi:predicted permease